ncbi:MAG: 6-phosphofructokinase [Candidatus Omnitrophota bacterium]|nr:MAG: 6-phosphofructokinase [Candidatus Omnitrophota bacterium]
MQKKKLRVGILTAGGDCPGLNAVIRAVAKKLIIEQDAEIIGIKDGYDGVIRNRYKNLSYSDVSGILTLGGTILGTSNIANPYRHAVKENGKVVFKDISKEVIQNIKHLDLNCLVCIGGDGTLAIGYKLFRDGIPVIGVPKTIDNDLLGTDVTFGFDTAVRIATNAIDILHSTAQAHHRIMIIEVMGRTAGWIALYSGIAGGGDIILLPEIPYDIEGIVARVKGRSKRGDKFSIIVISEGAKPKGGDVVVRKMVESSTIQARLGGVGSVLGEQLEDITGIETRTVVLGHLQRGGTPSAMDRILATELGTKAVELITEREFGYMVGVKGRALVKVHLEEVAKGSKLVPLKHRLIESARAVGTSFGDD